MALSPAEKQLTQVKFTSNGKNYDLYDFLAVNRVAGVLVLKDGKVAYEIVGTLDRAVIAGLRDAEASRLKEAVVLLSPACASFDQYPNFEVRGDKFRELVLALPGISPMAR